MKKYESLKDLKEDYKLEISQIAGSTEKIEEIKRTMNEHDTVRLFHGTTTPYLNSILTNGILPRSESQLNNWESNPSIPNVTYLTNKWHYFYAFHATDQYMDRKYGEEYTHDTKRHWWSTYEALPCYIECQIPKDLLVADEDFIYSDYMLKKIKSAAKKGKDIEISYEESLSQYGTAGVLGKVEPKYIKAFTVIGDIENLFEHFILESSLYRKEYQKWQEGKGKGKLKLLDLMKMEEKTYLNGTWFLKDMPKGFINGFGVNPGTNRLSINFHRL